jgi:FtsP/CotA-like multicopper oxidase with cupredoxin domain
MITRRAALVMIGVAPMAASIAPAYASLAAPASAASSASPASPVSLVTLFTPDRELHLTLSDNLQRQTWAYAGQTYTEVCNDIVVNEGEMLRLILTNDTERAQRLVLDGSPIELAANHSATVDLTIDQLQSKTLSNPLAGITRAIRVRPAYQSHALFAA